MLGSSALHTSGCRVNSNTVQTVLSPWPSGRSKAATARREQEKEIIVWLPLGMRREQQGLNWPISLSWEEQKVWGPHPPSEGQREKWGWVVGRGGAGPRLSEPAFLI